MIIALTTILCIILPSFIGLSSMSSTSTNTLPATTAASYFLRNRSGLHSKSFVMPRGNFWLLARASTRKTAGGSPEDNDEASAKETAARKSGVAPSGDECLQPPGPDCLVWDWNEKTKKIGTVVNYWCITTTSFVVFASMECDSNRTWAVVKRNPMPCTCEVEWLSPASYDDIMDWPVPDENAKAFVFT